MKVKAGRHDRLRFDEKTGFFVIEYDARPRRPHKERSTALAHELAHAITERAHRHSLDPKLYRAAMAGRVSLHIPLMREELGAWRLAKSICKPELWDERFAIRNFLTYFIPAPWMGKPYIRLRRKQSDKIRTIGILPLYRE
jgi:hypothetical protein